ncbi:MAG TPA: metallophosphoesterase [Treponemataceae bacterium]|nr:metallophosphoesterase [Treponemataceae bacterium]
MKKKKITAIILVVAAVVLVAVPVAISVPYLIDESQLNLAVMSDTHVLSELQMGTEITDSLAEQEAKGQKMLMLSEGLLKEGIDMVIEQKQEVLLLSGDLTDDGGKDSHEAVARQLKRAEENGVDCFVINGNHDINNHSRSYKETIPIDVDNVNAKQFATIYADFGYNEAVDKHSDSLSYTANLNREYRLLAIDCSFYEMNPEGGYVSGRNDAVTSDSLIQWIEKSLAKAKKDGKRVISMMHFPLTSHLTSLVDNNSVTVDRKDEVSNLLLTYDVKYIFTGHLHSQDIAVIDGEDGKQIFDIETASLSNYPMPIRFFKGTPKKEELTTKYITALKEEYIPKLIPAETKEKILEDLPAYSEYIVDNGMKIKVMRKLDTNTVLALLGALGLDKTEIPTIELAEDIRKDLITDFFDTPIYNDGTGKSVQEICQSFGISLPESGYTTVWTVAMKFLRANYIGNEGYKTTDTEGILLKYSLYTAFYKIADFDLFGKLNAQNPEVIAIDLKPAMENLFKKGQLDIIDNQLLGILGSVKAISSFQERWSTKPVIGNMIKNIDFSDPESLLEFISHFANLNLKLSAFVGGEGSAIGSIIDSISIIDILNYEDGYLNLGNVYDLLFAELGENLITDKAPTDDVLTVEKE